MFKQGENRSNICKKVPLSLKKAWLVSCLNQGNLSPTPDRLLITVRIEKVSLFIKVKDLLVPVGCN
jgi:hypothetical protein